MKDKLLPVFYSFKFVFKNSPFYAISLILTSIITTSQTYILAYFSKKLINLVSHSLTNHYFDNNILKIAVGLILFEVVACIVTTLIKYFSLKSNINYSNNMTIFLCDIAYKLDFAFFDDARSSDEAAQAKSDCQYISNMYSCIVSFVFGCISFIISLVICIKLNVFLAIFAVLITLPNFYIQKKARIDNYEQEKELNYINRKLGYFNSVFWGREYYMESHLFNLRDYLVEKLTTYQKIRTEKQMKLTRKNTIRETLFVLIILIINGGINLGIILLIILKNLTIGDYSYYTTILGNLKNTTSNIIKLSNEIINCHTRINNFLGFVEKHIPTPKEHTVDVPTDIDSIEFQDVWFKYPNTSNYVLENINLKINKGERIALAGINGAGKTTAILLMMRYYRPTKGKILLNGIDIEMYELVNYRNLFSTMFQMPIMYYLSIKENVSISNIYSPANDDIIRDCLTKSEYELGANHLETQLSKQFDSAGIIPSQGQLQKINLAKTLYRNSNIVILDEPSASLDAISEYNIFSKVYESCQGKMMFLVSHRLSNLKSMDRIYYFENHTIAEYGSHEELLANKGSYQKLYDIQANAF